MKSVIDSYTGKRFYFNAKAVVGGKESVARIKNGKVVAYLHPNRIKKNG